MESLSGGVGEVGFSGSSNLQRFLLTPPHSAHYGVLVLHGQGKAPVFDSTLELPPPPKRRQRLFQRVAGTVFVIQSLGLDLRPRVVSRAKSCIIPGRS